jgi:hypothetical protein
VCPLWNFFILRRLISFSLVMWPLERLFADFPLSPAGQLGSGTGIPAHDREQGAERLGDTSSRPELACHQRAWILLKTLSALDARPSRRPQSLLGPGEAPERTQ